MQETSPGSNWKQGGNTPVKTPVLAWNLLDLAIDVSSALVFEIRLSQETTITVNPPNSANLGNDEKAAVLENNGKGSHI